MTNLQNDDQFFYKIKNIIILSEQVELFLFNITDKGKWKLKSKQEIINIINNKNNNLHKKLCDDLKNLHESKSFAESHQVLKNHHLILMKLNKISIIIKNLYDKMQVIEYFSTDYV